MNIQEKLMKVQQELVAPKNLTNSFGKYKYRSCEGILESVKPLLKEVNTIIKLDDEVIDISGHLFIQATATFRDVESNEEISTKAYAQMDKHAGMSLDQCTGTASSYARKYALNGLLLIDDAKDSDANEVRKKKTPQEANKDASAPKAAQQDKTTKKQDMKPIEMVTAYWNNANQYEADVKEIINLGRNGKKLSELDENTLVNIIKTIEEAIK